MLLYLANWEKTVEYANKYFCIRCFSACQFIKIDCYVHFAAPKVELVEWNRYTVTWEALQAMRGDPIVYALQLLRGREVEQVWKGQFKGQLSVGGLMD